MSTSRSNFFVFCGMLAFSSVSVLAQVEADGFQNLIPQWLPQCFNGVDSFDPEGIVGCIQGNSLPSCMTNMTLPEKMMDIAQCINASVFDDVNAVTEGGEHSDPSNPLESFLKDVLGVNVDADGLINLGQVFVDATLECLNPLANCVRESIQEAVMTMLDPCVNQSITELVECGRANGEICQTTCNETALAANSNPFEGLDFLQVSTCPGIQANVMNPLCEVVACCQPCVAKVEALMDCVVNKQLDEVPAAGVQCDLACPVIMKRRLGQETNNAAPRRRILAEGESSEVCLQYAPGLTGDDDKELAARSSIFMSCAADSFLNAVESKEEIVEETSIPPMEENAKESSTSGGRAEFVAAGTMVAAVISFFAL